MKHWIKRLKARVTDFDLTEESEATKAKYLKLVEELNGMRDEFQAMRASFIDGGLVTFDQLKLYVINSPEHKVGYPTGRHVVSYRLPDLADGSLVFRVVCVAKPGTRGVFGRHWHDCAEVAIQWSGLGWVNGEERQPFSVSHFPAAAPHDYELAPRSELLVIFPPPNHD